MLTPQEQVLNLLQLHLPPHLVLLLLLLLLLLELTSNSSSSSSRVAGVALVQLQVVAPLNLLLALLLGRMLPLTVCCIFSYLLQYVAVTNYSLLLLAAVAFLPSPHFPTRCLLTALLQLPLNPVPVNPHINPYDGLMYQNVRN
jgi:hypothetical protein